MWKVRYLPHQLLRIAPESQVYSSSGAEEICNNRIIGALDPGKEQRRSLPVDNSAVDLRYLKPGIDFGCYLNQLPLSSE